MFLRPVVSKIHHSVQVPVEPENFFVARKYASNTRISETQTRNNYRSGGIGSGTYKRLSETPDPSR